MSYWIDKIMPDNASNVMDKSRSINYYVGYMLIRTQSMFKYSGLPSSIPAYVLERMLQCNGHICVTDISVKDDEGLHCFTGGLGGEPNVYYEPTLYVVANPRLSKSYNLKIDEDCIIIKNDSYYRGILEMIQRYATQLAENDISLMMADINTRIQSIITAGDDRTKASADKYIEDIVKGKLGVVMEQPLFNSLKTSPFSTSTTNAITDLIEYHQYLKGGLFNDLGVNANYNMKRESLNTEESQLNHDALLPLVDNMLNERQEGIEKVNAKYGTNISVELSSAWEEVQESFDDPDETPDDVPDETPDDEDKGDETDGNNNPQ